MGGYPSGSALPVGRILFRSLRGWPVRRIAGTAVAKHRARFVERDSLQAGGAEIKADEDAGARCHEWLTLAADLLAINFRAPCHSRGAA